MARRRIIAGNWKMNKTPAEAVELCNTLKDLVKNDNVDVNRNLNLCSIKSQAVTGGQAEP